MGYLLSRRRGLSGFPSWDVNVCLWASGFCLCERTWCLRLQGWTCPKGFLAKIWLLHVCVCVRTYIKHWATVRRWRWIKPANGKVTYRLLYFAVLCSIPFYTVAWNDLNLDKDIEERWTQLTHRSPSDKMLLYLLNVTQYTSAQSFLFLSKATCFD